VRTDSEKVQVLMAVLVREQYPKALWQNERTSVFNLLTGTVSGVNGYLPIAQAFIEKRISKEAYQDLPNSWCCRVLSTPIMLFKR